MSSLAPASVSALASADSRDHWITPGEQMNRLASPLKLTVRMLSRISGESPPWILGHNVASIIAQYLYQRPQMVTHWHTALTRLNAMPERIPPLPENIYHILNGPCPIHRGLKVKDTHTLVLAPEEFKSLNHFEVSILKPYGEENFPGNPLRFRYFWDEARKKHGDVPFEATHWVLMTKDVLPGSRDQAWNEQIALVDRLRKTALVSYAIPTLSESFAAITLHMVATGERLYPERTNTRVPESIRTHRLAVGGFTTSGVSVSSPYYGCDGKLVGVAARWEF